MRVAAAALDAIVAHARESLPAECCGLLVGAAAAIVEAVRSANLAEDPLHRFLIDPRAHIDARRNARERGLAVVGFYHSHPHSDPTPSPTDLEQASYTYHWYLIVRPLSDGYAARLFTLERSGFAEHDIERWEGQAQTSRGV